MHRTYRHAVILADIPYTLLAQVAVFITSTGEVRYRSLLVRLNVGLSVGL